MRPSRCSAPNNGPGRPQILHVVNALDGGGMERILVSLIGETAGDRLDHVVCTLRRPGVLAKRLPASVPLVSLGVEGPKSTTGLRLAGVIRKYRPDVVHTRNWGAWADAAVACALTGRPPLLLGFHGLQSDAGFSRRDRRRARWLQLVCRQFACVSYAGREQLERQLALPARRVEVICNGVQADRFAPPMAEKRERIRASLGISSHECVIGTVGWMTAVKDHATLLDAVGTCRSTGADVRLLLVGDGPFMLDLRARARRYGIASTTIFTGLRDDTPDLLGAMDLYASSSRSEGMSNAILEAMSVGLCVIATHVGDNARLLDSGGAGVIVPPRDPAALARAIQSLVDDPDRRRHLGARARRRVLQQYTFQSMVDRYLGLYRAMMNRLAFSDPRRLKSAAQSFAPCRCTRSRKAEVTCDDTSPPSPLSIMQAAGTSS